MASTIVSNQLDIPVSNEDQSPHITTAFNAIPSLPTLPPIDSVQSAIGLDLDEMSAYTQLEDENMRLKAQLAEIQSQRQAEQYAYTTFVKSAESIKTQLASQARTPALNLALKNLANASQTYRSLATTLNERYGNMNDLSFTSSMMTAATYPNEPTPSPRQQLTTGPSHHLHSYSQLHHMVLLIRHTLAELQIPRPKPPQSFATALNLLENNAKSFTPFIVDYLNGRHRHLTSGLRSQIDKIIGIFFDDPDDAKQVIDKILRVLKASIVYVEKDMQGLGGDIIDPLGGMLWALADFLDNQA